MDRVMAQLWMDIILMAMDIFLLQIPLQPAHLVDISIKLKQLKMD